ncbi:MAG: hypothetical protein R2798_08575 [Chitinophagales bacterium]
MFMYLFSLKKCPNINNSFAIAELDEGTTLSSVSIFRAMSCGVLSAV